MEVLDTPPSSAAVPFLAQLVHTTSAPASVFCIDPPVHRVLETDGLAAAIRNDRSPPDHTYLK